MKIQQALIEFQKKGIKVGKNKTNPHFKSKYADLSHILERVTPVLTELGVSVTNFVRNGELVTRLSTDEDFIESSFPLFGSKAQELGASQTYARRYNLGALLSLDIDDDDDGNFANEQPIYVKKPTFNEDNFDKFVKVISKFATADEAISEAEKKYEVSLGWKNEIRKLYE